MHSHLTEHDLLAVVTRETMRLTAVTTRSKPLKSPFDTDAGMLRLLLGIPQRMLIRDHKDILYLLDEFRNKKQEYLVCLSISSSDRLIAKRVVTIGTLDSALAHPREVFADPLADRAAYIIIAHNHPSGEARPSGKDIEMTQQMAAAGQILGVKLRDHFVITKNGYFSFKQKHFRLCTFYTLIPVLYFKIIES